MNDDIFIPVKELTGNFSDFLKVGGDNQRVFFSGKFGIGKTYFLKTFFDINKEEFECFHLFPVNYQISSNEDIIQLLKYDLLVDLIKKDGDLFKENKIKGIKDSALLFYSWVKENHSLNDFLQAALSAGESTASLLPNPILGLLGKLGKPLKDLLNIDKEFQEFKDHYIAGEKGIAEKYIETMKSKDISESDYLGHLINIKICDRKGKKKSVLILDDIDRIDPEHVFRILNVFSAHFNQENNKFGFDIVVIVADIENIKSIFHHKYGTLADFSGYIDKFFTVKPYYFDNKKIVAEVLPNLVKQIKCDEPQLQGAIGESGYIKLFLSDILSRALDLNQLNLRQLYKPINYGFVELKKGVYSQNTFRDSFQQLFDVGVKLLLAIYGDDVEKLLEVLEEIEANIPKFDTKRPAPYDAFSGTMAKALLKPQINAKEKWRDYLYTLAQHDRVPRLTVEGDGATEMKFYFDLLREYISTQKYKKESEWDYDV